MPALGLLHARDLPALAGLDELRARLTAGPREDVRLVHAPAGEAAHTPAGLVPGVTLFGPGRSPAMTASPTGLTPLRETTSVLLHDALFLAGSMTVLDSRDRLFRDGIDNLPDPATLADGGTLYARDPDGALAMDASVRRGAERVDRIALPVCGIGLPNYGHFLLDGLPAVLLHAQLFADLPCCVVGQRLHPWQEQILSALGLRDRYMEAGAATVFDRVLTSTLLAMHLSHPTRLIRPVFDMLRFAFGPAGAGAPRKVFLSRAGHDGWRALRNRQAVETALRLLGFAIIRPDAMSVADQAAAMAEARFVIGESGAAMGNVGFCPQGAKVLELQPERFVEGWTRGLCFHLGHRWHLYLARVDSPPLRDAGGRPLDPNRHFSYDIDPLDLMAAVARIEAAA